MTEEQLLDAVRTVAVSSRTETEGSTSHCVPEVRQPEIEQKYNAEKAMEDFKMQLPIFTGEGNEISPYEFLDEITEFC